MQYLKYIILLVLSGITVIGIVWVNLTFVDKDKLYSQITIIDQQATQNKVAIEKSITLFPAPSVHITDAKNYNITAKFGLFSLLTFRAAPYALDVEKLNTDTINYDITQIESLIPLMAEHGLKELIIHNASQAIAVNVTGSSAQIKASNPSYTLQTSAEMAEGKFSHGIGQFTITDLALLDTLIPLNLAEEAILSTPLTLGFKFDQDSTKLTLYNFTQGDTNITGSVIVPFADTAPIEVTLAVNELDFSGFALTHKKSSTSRDPIQSLFGNKIVNADITINTLTTRNEKIQKFTLKNTSVNNIPTCDISAELASGGKINATITKQNNANNYKFILNHKDSNKILAILGSVQSTDIAPVPLELSVEAHDENNQFVVDKLTGKLSEVDITGSGSFVAPNASTISKLSLKTKNLNLDQQHKLPIFTPLLDYFIALTQDIESGEYVKKFIPIRTITTTMDVIVEYENASLYGYKITSGILDTHMMPNIITVRKFDNLIDDNRLTLAGQIDASSLYPIITCNVLDAAITVTAPDAISKQVFDILTTKLSKHPAEFSGQVHLSKLNMPNLSLRNINGAMTIKQNLLTLTNVSMEFADKNQPAGKATISANMNLAPFNAASSFSIENGDLKILLPVTPLSQLPVSAGWVNVIGTASTSAANYSELLKNISLDAKIAGAGLRMNGINIDDVLTIINDPTYKVPGQYENFVDITPRNFLFKNLKSATTDFVSASASVRYEQNVATLKDGKFTTKYASGSLALAYTPQNAAIDLQSMISFYLAPHKFRTSSGSALQTVNVKYSGDAVKKYTTLIEAKSVYDYLVALRAGII